MSGHYLRYPLKKRYRHPRDTYWKAHPLAALIRDAVREALEYVPTKHPDYKRQRKAAVRDRELRAARKLKSKEKHLDVLPFTSIDAYLQANQYSQYYPRLVRFVDENGLLRKL